MQYTFGSFYNGDHDGVIRISPVNNVILEPSPCTDVAAKVHNQCTLTALVPKHPNTVVFHCQLPEDFRNQMTSNERSVGVIVEVCS